MKSKSIFFILLTILALFGERSIAQDNQAGFTLGYSSHTSYWFRRASGNASQTFPINKTTKSL